MLNEITNTIINTVSIVFNWIFGIIFPALRKLRHQRTPEEEIRKELSNAKGYAEWLELAHKLDDCLGNDEWKSNPISPYYDHNLIQVRLNHLRQARESNDLLSMIYTLRSGLLRNLGGLNDPRLFSQSYLGTKGLIEDYTREVVNQLEYIAEHDFCETPNLTKVEFFNDTRQSFGSTALVLYGGSSFGLYHLGVVKALNEKGLLPRIISGTAVGALIAALVCIRTDEELPKIFEPGGVDLGAFGKVGSKGNIRRKISRFLKHGYLMDIKVLEECVRTNVGDLTFEEAYAKTNRVLNITVSPTRKFEVPQLLNYLTAPNVLISSAACASVAVIGLYESYELMAKDKTGKTVPWAPTEIRWKKWTDSVPTESESPLKRITELFNVNHFIVSQASTAIAPLLSREQTTRASLLVKCGHFISTEVRHRMSQLEQLRLLPTVFRGLVDEKVSGNVTIVPSITFSDFKSLLSNPTHSSLDNWILKGEQSTWPLLALIKSRCMVELALDRIYLRLKTVPPTERGYLLYKEKTSRRKRTKSVH
ncbi:16014_t:CDS:10 [Acaulospora morrowiae]|uniref:16014_t:CDS:1 n=1 Tax=Acaulospora morrowiae TaxID=94023 RepID=A0A9N8W3F8_9GLOM|nr:16014_t:CDS:10 [Acaulospora morrowiae]